MLKNEKSFDSDGKMGEKSHNYFFTMRRNVDKLMDERNMTVKQLAELSGLNIETVKTFLYDKDSKDCKLSTAVGIAKAFNKTIAELAETGTIDNRIIENMQMYRELPQSSRSLIDWHIRNQKFLHEEHDGTRTISIMNPVCANNGNLKRTYDYESFETTNLHEELYHKVFFGIRIPCEHYIPQYLKDDILLIANDRIAMGSEKTIIIVNDNIVITHRVVENGKVCYYGIRDNLLHATDLDNVQIVGYIAKVIRT